MKKINLISAILLALPLIVLGSNYFFPFIPPIPEGDSVGRDLLQMMRDEGLMDSIAFSHVVIGIMLLITRFRTLGALLQLPMTIGIVSFHITMQPVGLLFAIILLIFNIGALNLKSFLEIIR